MAANRKREINCIDCGKKFITTSSQTLRCKPCVVKDARERAKQWYRENKKKKQNYDKKYAKDKISLRREASKRWREKKPADKAMDVGNRRKLIKLATPIWADKKAMHIIYKKAKRLGLTVDHIYPIRGKMVCGLHCEQNLQLLTLEENARKNNHYEWPI